MRTKRIGIMLTILMSMVTTKAFAYDIAVENEDKVTIYYNYINDGAELEVTYGNDVNTPSYSGEVVIPSEVTYENITRKVTSIGGNAFRSCSGLTSVTIGDRVISIGKYAFADCSGLTSVTIPNSVTSIGYDAFMNCIGLTSITIPNSVTSIGKYAFEGCISLTSIIIPNSVTAIGDYTFYHCYGLTSAKIGNGVTEIGKGVFQECKILESVFLANSVTTIGDYAFWACSLLSSITIPNSVTAIGDNAFAACVSLTSITIPNNVTIIGSSAFGSCNSLTSVTIPNSVTTIGNGAFKNCSGLTSATIGNGVTTISDCIFENCSNLTSIVVESGNSVFDSRNNCNAIIETATNTLLQGCKATTIPNSVTSIGEKTFYKCNALTSITIPNSVTIIGNGAFQFCEGLTSATIGNSVASIGLGAFEGCNSLTTVVSLNENPSSIDFLTFSENTTNNATLYVPQGTIDKYQATEGWNQFLHIEELNSSNMCATPTISYKNGKLSCNCETEGAICHTTITNEDIKSFDDNEIDLTVTYNISVYATKDGYFDSDVANATLCWIEVNPQNEGITTDVNQIASVAVLIKANGGQLTIEGADDNTTITAYTLDGVQLGSAVSRNGVASINTNVSAGTVTIVKIGNKSVKVVMK